MYDIALLLHIYQPPTQYPEVLREIAETSYRPLMRVLKETPRARVTLNICGSLTEQLEHLGYQDILSDIRLLVEDGKVVLTGSAKYHPLLPKLPPQEIKHQIQLNQETNERLLGRFEPQGFFLPELAYTFHVGRLIEQMGFTWLIVEDLAFADEEHRRHDRIYGIEGTKLNVIFRDRLLSLGIAFGSHKSPESFLKSLEAKGEEGYSVLAMDGETFGHHHRGAMDLLMGLLSLPEINWLTVPSLLKKYETKREDVNVLPSTWGLMEVGPRQERIFPRWDNPDNPLHVKQWQLFYLALSVMMRCNADQEGYLMARAVFDKAVHSDQFFWAGGDPCWHPGMVERGASLLKEAIEKSPSSFPEERRKAVVLVDEIISLGRELYGEGIVLE